MTQSKTTPHIPKSLSWQMFNDISLKYDLLNNLLSFGLHNLWKKKLATHLSSKRGQRILDLATGTADVIISFLTNNPNVESGIGMDMAEKMLDVGRKKIAHRGLAEKIKLKHGDANQIPFEDQSFDGVSISFGIRNVEDPSQVLREMHRTLKSEGRGLVLEFSFPNNKILKAFHLFYLRTVVPCIGWIFSGHYKAYKYLNQTIETFPYGDDFCQLMSNVGFKNVKANPLLFGVATIYQGDK